MSLQTILLKQLQLKGEMTYDEVVEFITEHNYLQGTYYKMKTVERELNPSRTNKVETLKNDNHFIKGYRYIGEAKQEQLFKTFSYC